MSLTSIVGTKYITNGERLLRDVPEGSPLLLVHEPQNAFDTNAVAVYVRVGFVPAAVAKTLAPQLDASANPVGTCVGTHRISANGFNKVEIPE